MKWFITGGSGQIGGWIIRSLLEAGEVVCNYDLEGTGTLRWHGILADGLWTRGSILDAESLEGAMRRFAPDVVIHLAAQSGVEAARREPHKSMMLNVAGTLNVLEACRRLDVPRVLVASSNHVYGAQEGLTGEEAPMRQRDLYSASKICADVMAQAYRHNYGLNVTAVRNTNVYGPCSPHGDHLIEGTILSALKGERPILRSNGSVRKAYLYAADCADAYITLGRCHDTDWDAVNVSTNPSVSALEVVTTILRLMGSPMEPIVLGQPNDQHHEELDSRRMASLGWEPHWSLERGLTETISWFRTVVVPEKVPA